MFSTLPDVRRTIKTSRPVTGQEIAEALSKYVQFESDDLYTQSIAQDIDGECKYFIGIKSEIPGRNISVAYGESLEDTDIKLNETYSKIGIRSSCYVPLTLKEFAKFTDKDIVERMNDMKSDLEGLLNNLQN
jgi:hypothetical protein